MTALSRTKGSRGSRVRTLMGGAVGHFIEWYDWSIYGFLAGVFAQQMFPAADPAVSLIASFSAFAIGFLGRPLGALVLSPLADRHGRKALLSVTILMAGFGGLAIALCPTYAQIGVAAPAVIVIARLLQGVSAGGEFQIAVAFLNEHADSRHRAFGASFQTVSIGLAVLAATGMASLVARLVPADALVGWGWRIPFLVGAALSLFGLYLRRGLAETPAFAANVAPARARGTGAVLTALARYPREMIIVFVVQINGLQYYLWMIFLPTYATLVGGLDRASGFAGSILASLFYCVCVPLFALISDRIGRKPLLIGSAAGFLIFTYPMLSTLAVPHLGFDTYVLVALGGVLLVSANNAVLGTVFAELFPTDVRASGIGIPYAVSGAIFGGTAPAAATWLQTKGGPLFVSLYVMLVCLVTLAIHFALTPETRGRALD